MTNADKIILDLCGGTGSWSRPYKDAGYDVRLITLPHYDIARFGVSHEFKELRDTGRIYGVLAAPPCTQFSIARTTAKIPRSFQKGMVTVRDCLDIIWKCQGDDNIPRLKFWAIENPAQGYLRQFLGKPAFIFEPLWFGDRHTKKTALWGRFNEPERKPIRLNFGDKYDDYQNNGAEIPEGYVMPPDMTKRQVRRSITPPNFARAFMQANR